MASGVAVIGSNSGEIPWVIGDTGILFPEGDAVALAEALMEVMRDEARRNDLARRGRERVLAHFTHAHIAEATAGVYRSL
jgi:glycosyltransferase involved in cell wall biosynthesis